MLSGMNFATAPDAAVAVRWIAAFEALKGTVVLLAASGVLTFVHHDLHALAARLMAHAHLNPAAHYPGVWLAAIDQLQNTRVLWLALGALAYASLRFAEAWGLFFRKTWAELLAAGSGAVYVPFEVAELVRHPGALSAALLLANLAVVAIMLLALWRRRAAGAL